MNDRRRFIIGIKSIKLAPYEKVFLKKYKPWGVILFSRNIKTIQQTKKLTSSIRKIFNDENYPILIDQEGGRVQRLTKIVNFSFDTGKYFGDLYNLDKKKFKNDYNSFINKTSSFLKQIGININTVPVLDIRNDGSSNIIGDRSFSDNAHIVSKIGDYCIYFYHKNNIGTVMKHIPGHGLAKVDSHKFTPTVNQSLENLLKNDFFTFMKKKTIFAMTAHIIYKKIDNIHTATHSPKIINMIRNKIKFNGILMSDDISMYSLKFSIKNNTLKAFKAGCDLVLHCNGNYKEMLIVADNAPFVDNFIVKKTSQFYKILS